MSSIYELTVREKAVGGATLNVVRRRGRRLTDPRLIILVHGFNVTEREAAESLAGFGERLASRLAGAGRNRTPTWAFYWPGDYAGGKLAAAAYPVKVPEARLSGERLGQLLTTLQPEQEVILIGHSLGCRVLLEALRYVADAKVARGAQAPKVPVVCLMAAAVPVQRCTAEGSYSAAILTAPIHVLHSRRDLALRVLFRLGQVPAEENMGEAVGLHGGPAERWAEPNYQMKLGHTKYLAAPEAAEKVAGIIEPTLGRTPDSRPLPAAEAPEPRDLPGRQMASRALGDDLDAAWTDCWPVAGATTRFLS